MYEILGFSIDSVLSTSQHSDSVWYVITVIEHGFARWKVHHLNHRQKFHPSIHPDVFIEVTQCLWTTHHRTKTAKIEKLILLKGFGVARVKF